VSAAQLAPCGTVAAYQRHRKAGDERCEPCWAAMAAYERERRRGGKPAASERALRRARGELRPVPVVAPFPALDGHQPCSADPDAWFPEHDDHAAIARAKQACTACPALEQCRAWVLANPQRWGVWAGLSPADRKYPEREAA
jgi:hypothetical protein